MLIRVEKTLDFLQAKKARVNDFEIATTMNFGPGVFERVMRIIRTKYDFEVKRDRSKGTWEFIPLENKNEVMIDESSSTSSPSATVVCSTGETT